MLRQIWLLMYYVHHYYVYAAPAWLANNGKTCTCTLGPVVSFIQSIKRRPMLFLAYGSFAWDPITFSAYLSHDVCVKTVMHDWNSARLPASVQTWSACRQVQLKCCIPELHHAITSERHPCALSRWQSMIKLTVNFSGGRPQIRRKVTLSNNTDEQRRIENKLRTG